ncbi:MAG: hypothetical protein F4Y01_02020 [Gammaproteobacteria bacterium]|nr:hypothetical protein [Gammaproteobacteria bacterium]
MTLQQIRTAIASVVLATLVGCGFQLRNWDLSSAFASASVVATEGVTLDDALVRALGHSGLDVVPEGGDVVLRLSQEREERRSAAVTAAGRAAEVELALEVTFSVQDVAGEELAPERVLRVARVQRIDVDNIVGSSEEEALLQGEMRQELASRMVRSLAMVAKAHGAQATDAAALAGESQPQASGPSP